MSPVLAQLIEAKRHSDNKRYERKNQIIRKLMQQAPQDWQVDDPNSYHKGVTHMPTGFRLHVDPAIINSQVQQLAKQAFLNWFKSNEPEDWNPPAINEQDFDADERALKAYLKSKGYKNIRQHIYEPGDTPWSMQGPDGQYYEYLPDSYRNLSPAPFSEIYTTYKGLTPEDIYYPSHHLSKQAASTIQELPWRERVEVLTKHPRTNKIYGGIWDSDKSFAAPGGGIDPGETPEQAAIRELAEETGISANNPVLLPIGPVDHPWSDAHRARTGRNFAGSRTHFVLADYVNRNKDQKLDLWRAGKRKFYAPEQALALMENKQFQAPVVAEARAKAIRHIIDMLQKKDKAALSKQAATIIMRKITMRITATPKTEDTPKMSCVETLQDLLYNSIDMTLAFQKCHWNVKGTMFKPMHDFLGQGYDMMDEIVDELAERIATLDSPADGSPGEVAAQSALDALATKFMQPESILNELAARLSTLIDKFNEAISDTDDDPVTSNMLQDMTHKLEKYHWMLRSQKEKTDDSVKSAAAKAFMFLFRKGR